MNKNQNQIPEMGFVRLPQILSVIPISKSSWWLGVKNGKYPKPIKLGRKISAWKVEEIKQLIEELGGCTNEEI